MDRIVPDRQLEDGPNTKRLKMEDLQKMGRELDPRAVAEMKRTS